jgi:hypothetical protein
VAEHFPLLVTLLVEATGARVETPAHASAYGAALIARDTLALAPAPSP